MKMVNWYKHAKKTETRLIKQAGLDVGIVGYTPPEKKDTIGDLCYYVLRRFWVDAEKKLTPEEMKQWTEKGIVGYDFITPDGNDHDEKYGIINNYIKAFPSDKIQWLINYVIENVKEAGATITNISSEKYPNSKELRVIRYKVGFNPNAHEKKDVPPEIHMTGTSFSIIGTLLGLKENIANGATLDAAMVVNEAALLKDDALVEKRLLDGGLTQYVDEAYGSYETLRGKAEWVAQAAKWALDHGYKQIYIS